MILNNLFLGAAIPLALLVYWYACRTPRHKLWALCLISYGFYGLTAFRYVPLLLGLSLITYGLARLRRTGIGIVVNLLALVVFKYSIWGEWVVQPLPPGVIPLSLRLAVPLGISYVVLKHLSYLLDVRAGRQPPTTDFWLFTTYSALFLQITAGPISRFELTGDQLARLPTKADSDSVMDGLKALTFGLAKQVFLAGPFLAAFQLRIESAERDLLWAWLTVLLYVFYIYFDFSGYTDMVIGLGQLFGLQLPANFDNPLASTSVRQFWQRWHTSLSTWFQQYVYFPTSRALLKRGSARQELIRYVTTLLTVILIGLWHGGSTTFLLWGLYQGVLLNAQAWVESRFKQRLPLALTYPVFLATLLIGWAIFLSPTLGAASHLIVCMTGLCGIGSPLLPEPKIVLTLLLAFALITSRLTEAAHLPTPRRWIYGLLLGILAALCLLQLGTGHQVLYANF